MLALGLMDKFSLIFKMQTLVFKEVCFDKK